MERGEGLGKPEEEPWRVLEFYSGIGGMRYSIMRACVNATVVEAFDINDIANDVYEHNFGHRPCQGNIQTLSAADLDSYMAHAWLLSPPCQPYTRQGLQKDSDDARASSFLKILELIPLALRPPLVLFVENVVGFEASDTHSKMVEMLKKMHFVTQEFILSPLQFGVPYSRPRYFCLAKRKPLSFQSAQFNNHLLWEPSLLFGKDEDKLINEARSDKLLEACKPVGCFLEFENSSDPIKQNTSLLSAENSADVPKKIDGQNKSVASSFVRWKCSQWQRTKLLHWRIWVLDILHLGRLPICIHFRRILTFLNI